MANPSVLVTDDDEDLRLLISMHLEMSGFRVLEANDGAEALDVARREPPDLMLLDLMMPVMDGWECLSEFKNDEALADIPVFIITGKNLQEDKERALAMGAEAFIPKPFQGPDLIARIRARLGA